MTEEIRYIANLQRQEEFDNEVTELEEQLKRLEQENEHLRKALEEIDTILNDAYRTGRRTLALAKIRDKIIEVLK